MLPTRVQGTRLPYTFPPHYLLNATFHAGHWMLPTRVQGTRLPYTFPPHYLLNATFHAGHWMLPTRVQGTRLPYTFPPHYLHFMLNVGCYQPEFRASGYHTCFHSVTCTFHAERWMLPGHQTTIHISTPSPAECYTSC